jgi:hypothetical protein
VSKTSRYGARGQVRGVLTEVAQPAIGVGRATAQPPPAAAVQVRELDRHAARRAAATGIENMR